MKCSKLKVCKWTSSCIVSWQDRGILTGLLWTSAAQQCSGLWQNVQSVLVTTPEIFLSVISVEPVLPALLNGLSVLQALPSLAGSLMLILCSRNVPFHAPHHALLFPQRVGPPSSSRFLLTQSKRSKEASVVLPSEKKLACINLWFPWRTEVLTVSSHRRGRR